jgi:hypothetical protein
MSIRNMARRIRDDRGGGLSIAAMIVIMAIILLVGTVLAVTNGH